MATRMPDGRIEPSFRSEIRDILDLDPFTHDEQIFDKLRRWKRLLTRREDSSTVPLDEGTRLFLQTKTPLKPDGE